MNTTNNTAPCTVNPCTVCGTPDAEIVRYTVRGISGTPNTGRLVLKGRPLCDVCGMGFETASNG